MFDKRDPEDTKMIRRAAYLVAEYAKAHMNLPADVLFSIGVLIGSALRDLPPRESDDDATRE